ncbi:hypothetical protein SpCBS45565_g07317 [Spizellomyces sp. 'palustris']|nr:hypothetical protein SpCBS45565_g07317 [Spizellomyces sp. 'palustris']
MEQSQQLSSAQTAPVVSVSFPYPVTTYDGIESGTTNVLAQVCDRVRALCEEIGSAHGCHITFATPESILNRQQGPCEINLSVNIMGPFASVLAARAVMLKRIPTQTMITVKASRKIILNDNDEMKITVKRKLDNIMHSSRTQITCVGQNYETVKPPPGLSSESMDVEIVGHWEDVEMARMQTLVLLDEMAGLHCEPVEIQAKLHPLIAGRKRCILETVMHDTVTNVYLPTPFIAETGAHEVTKQVLAYSHTIWITGQLAGVAAAKERLLHMAAQRASMLMTKHITSLPRKLDWMLVNRKDHLRKVMQDNATHIGIPTLGSNVNTLTISGDDRVYLERTCRALMHMVCDFYVAGLQLSAPPIPQATIAAACKSTTITHFIAALGRICQSSRAEVVVQKNFVEIYGLEAAVKSAYQHVADLDFIKGAIRDTKFQLELALEHREFINGKKNGKINKIIKASGCKITFQENYNEYNMLIDVYNAYPTKAVEGLALLEDELPAEISFYVPEAFHKRIIGVGGKNIQRIMKKYAVYVKFSNAEEFAQLGGYFENMDNVIARTPAKNSANLDNLRVSIMELTSVGEKNRVTMSVIIPRQLHRVVVGPRGSHLQDIIKVAKVEINFPEKETGLDEVTIAGPEPQVQIARQRLQELVPEIYEFSIPGSPAAFYAVRSTDLQQLVMRLSQELAMDLYVYMPPTEEPGPSECSFLLHYHRNNGGALDQAKSLILEFLTIKQVPLQRQSGMPRAGSYANLQPQRSYDSFQHFPSKLIASVTTGDSPAPAMAFSSFFPEGIAGLAGTSGTKSITAVSSGIGGSKFAHSTPNLRQLFEDVSYARGGTDQHMKRSRSDINDEMLPTTNLLAATLAATSLGPSQYPSVAPQDRWAAAGGTPFSRRGDFRPEPIDTTSDLEDPSKDPELLKGFAGMLSPVDAPERPDPPLRVPSDKFCGLKLSRSMGMLDEKSKKREPGVRAPSNLAGEASGVSDPEDPSHAPAFTPALIAQLFEMEARIPKDFLQIRVLLESLDLENYVSIFIEQEIDFPTLLLLQDADLKEIGVKAFGSRKKILNAIKECKEHGGTQKQGAQSSPPHQHHQRNPHPSPAASPLRRSDLPTRDSHSARGSVPSAYTASPIMQRSSVGNKGGSQSPSSTRHSQQGGYPGSSTSSLGGQRKGFASHYVYSSGPELAAMFQSHSTTTFTSLSHPTTSTTSPTTNTLLQSGPGKNTPPLDSSLESSTKDGTVIITRQQPIHIPALDQKLARDIPSVASVAVGTQSENATRPRAAPNGVDFFAKFEFM